MSPISIQRTSTAITDPELKRTKMERTKMKIRARIPYTSGVITSAAGVVGFGGVAGFAGAAGGVGGVAGALELGADILLIHSGDNRLAYASYELAERTLRQRTEHARHSTHTTESPAVGHDHTSTSDLR